MWISRWRLILDRGYEGFFQVKQKKKRKQESRYSLYTRKLSVFFVFVFFYTFGRSFGTKFVCENLEVVKLFKKFYLILFFLSLTSIEFALILTRLSR